MENSTQNYIRTENNLNTTSSNPSSQETTITITPNQISNIPKRKIGRNLVINCLGIKRIIGIPDTIFAYILTNIGMFIVEFGWIISNNYYFPYLIYLIQLIFYFLTIYYMFICFFKDPGIIPRYNPNFQIKEEEINEMLKNEKEENEKAEKEENENKDNKENKEETKLKTENNNNKDEKEKLKLPSILKERKCVTCHIIKPPKTSHCRFCDNCIQGLDHHCFFISNCVGKRNHKFFFLFLICGTIGSVKMVILGFFTIYNVFITNRKETIYLFIKEDKKLFIICSSLLAICLLFILFNPRSFCCTVVPGLIGLGIMFHLWYKHLHHKTNLPDYFNCFLLPFYIGSWSFFLFVVCTFVQQLCYISSGYTIKQTKSIEEEIIDINNNSNRQKIKSEYIRNKTFGEKINNIITFLKAERGESLIVPERDLIP